MICVVIDAAVDAVGVADAVDGGATTGIITGGLHGTRVQVKDGGLSAPALTKDTEWDLKTGDGIGIPATDKERGRVPAQMAGPAFLRGPVRAGMREPGPALILL